MIEYIGLISRAEVDKLYGKSKIGLVLYQPAKNHYESQPIKLFEYMAAGLPIVCSNFDLWKTIVEDGHCGICVDCTSKDAVYSAINKIIHSPGILTEMSNNGYSLVKEKCCWDSEEKKLIDLYLGL